MVPIDNQGDTLMLTQLAALGIGLITTVASPIVHAAQPGCDTAHPSAAHPPYRAPAPTYVPAPTYASARPPRHQAPPVRHVEAPVVMRRADYNRDGGVTLQEARAYGRIRFIRADRDGNGVLTRRELNNADSDFSRVSQSRGGLTLAEYHASITSQFHGLDRNRDAFLSRHELGTASRNDVTHGWNASR
jgi:hypothetical protein